MVRLGLLWKPVVKGGTYPRGYFRVRGVARSSKKVKAVNKAFAEAARACKAEVEETTPGKRLKAFNQCIKKKLEGKTYS